MRTIHLIFVSAMLAASALPAVAKTTVISQLGTSPLIGQSSSSAALKTNVAQHERLLERAAAQMGLSPAEYASLRQQIAASHYTWVTVPRHLDAMSWASGRKVHVIRDVMIPARTNGWEVDLRRDNQVLALFMPAVCGNLSLIRRNMPVVAKAAPPKAVAKVVPPPPAPVPVGAPPQVLGVETAPAPPADTVVTAAAVHHASLLPLLLGIIPFIGGGGGGGSSGHGGGGSLPPPTGCTCH